jgi:hypothetical protein
MLQVMAMIPLVISVIVAVLMPHPKLPEVA